MVMRNTQSLQFLIEEAQESNFADYKYKQYKPVKQNKGNSLFKPGTNMYRLAKKTQ